MAIFNSDNRKPQEHVATTIIAGGAHFRGQFELGCNFHLDGEIEGKVNSDHAIRIGKDGQITGEIKAETLIVAGRVKGDVRVRVAEILDGGLIEGTVYCNELIIAKGGHFFGESKPLESNVVKALTNKDKTSTATAPLQQGAAGAS